MNQIPRRRLVSPSLLLVSLAIAGAVAAGSAGATSAADACVYYELPYEQAWPVVVDASDPLCPANDAAVVDINLAAGMIANSPRLQQIVAAQAAASEPVVITRGHTFDI